VPHSQIRRSIAASQKAYSERKGELGYQEFGSLLLGTREQLEEVRETDLIDTVYRDPVEIIQEVPLLAGHDFETALFTPGDGVMDISRLLQFYLKEAWERSREFQLKLSCKVTSVNRIDSRFRVETTQGVFEPTVVVNGAGAWAPEIAEMAGVTPLPMSSFKRHLFILDNIDEIDPGWPFIWSLDKNFYFRPESGGLLFSVCDEERCEHVFQPTVSQEVIEILAEMIAWELPRLSEAVQRQAWSCFRTKTPDGSFHLGWSDNCPDFYWVAGLGGHGMGASWEVGRLAAQDIVRRFASGES
jgi:glycine/D-amino acid oxidase-like deaminating enzyme